MNRLHRSFKERLKFYILISLLIISFVQLGILWGYENQGLPFNFMNVHASAQNNSDSASHIGNFFTPYKVIASEGSDSSQWIINKTDSNYNSLWEDAKYYLKKALQMKSEKSDISLKEWYNLVNKRVFVFQFNVDIKLSLLKDFLNITEVSSDAPLGLLKMIISPWEDTTNVNSNSIYINDGIKIYKYTLQLNPKGHFNNIDSYNAIINELINNTNLRAFNFLKLAYGNNPFGFNEDLSVIISGSKYMKYNGLESSLFPGFDFKQLDSDKIAFKILGSEKGYYDSEIYDADKSIEFKTLDNIYKIYSNGFMEYNYTPIPSSNDKGAISDAFSNAAEFVNKLNLETDNTKLFFSDYKEDKDTYYEFEFDYMVSDKTNDVPVYLNYSYKDLDGKTLNLHHAIIIKANSKNVLSCTAMLKTFNFNGEIKDYAVGLSEAKYLKDQKISADNAVAGKDVAISYQMGNEVENKSLPLIWVIKAGSNYYTSTITSK